MPFRIELVYSQPLILVAVFGTFHADIPAVVIQPAMFTAVEVQQHPRHRPPRAAGRGGGAVPVYACSLTGQITC